MTFSVPSPSSRPLLDFTAALAENFWSVTAQVVRGSGTAESRKFHSQAQIQGGGRDREIWKFQDRSGVHSSAISVSGPWLKREVASAQLARSLQPIPPKFRG